MSNDQLTRHFIKRESQPWRTIICGFAGAFVGYIVFTILGNLEKWPFYTIRSLITGQTAMSEIIENSADCWVLWSLFFGLILGGAFLGMWLARQSSGRKRGGVAGMRMS